MCKEWLKLWTLSLNQLCFVMHTIVLTLCNYFYKSPYIVSIYLLIAGGTVHHQRHAQKTVQQVQFYTSSYFHIRAAFWQNVNVCICRNSLPRSNGNYSVISQIKPNKLHVKKGEISTVDPWDSLGLICYNTWSVSSWAACSSRSEKDDRHESREVARKTWHRGP